MVYRIVKSTVIEAATAIEETDPQRADTLKRASTHWFRHTAITHQADNGIELRHLKKSARHNDINTTSKYLHAEAERWHTDLSKHRMPG
jgi:site-specific recombinase XerD